MKKTQEQIKNEKKIKLENIKKKNIEKDNKLANQTQPEQISEGKAKVKLSNIKKTFNAFYNPAQELNRDLTILSTSTFLTFDKYLKDKQKKLLNEYQFSIIEPLSATGLRGLRYYTELPLNKIKVIVLNDLDANAVECINQNLELNNVDINKFQVYQKDASLLLYENMNKFDIIDLDPYGTAMPFIDSCILGAKNNALCCITFTDMPVLCGNYPETTLYKYCSIPHKWSNCHEMALRIALYAISINAAKYKKTIKPLFSFNAEFYVRLFFIIKDSADDCKQNSFKYGYMYHCRTCQNRVIIPMANTEDNLDKKGKVNTTNIKFNNLIYDKTKCHICDGNMRMTGPYWIDNIHDIDFIKNMLNNLQKEEFKYLKYNQHISCILKGALEELPLSKYIFNYDYPQFAKDVSISNLKLDLLIGALNSLGYKFAQSYYNPNLFKTDAPSEVLYDIFKQYKKENYKEEYLSNVKEGTYNYNILTKEIKHIPIFIESKRNKELKYPLHPFENWGPKGKAKEIK